MCAMHMRRFELFSFVYTYQFTLRCILFTSVLPIAESINALTCGSNAANGRRPVQYLFSIARLDAHICFLFLFFFFVQKLIVLEKETLRYVYTSR